MMTGLEIDIAPLVPWWLIATLGGAVLALAAYCLWRRARGTWLRLAAALVLLTALVNPSVVREDREPLPDVAAVIVDQSPSQEFADRADVTEATLETVRDRLGGDETLEMRVVRAGGEGQADGPIDSTRLMGDLASAMSDVPRDRRAGAVLITDGQVHDIPGDVDGLAEFGPIHTLLTGRRDETDRRVKVVSAPRYGIVGQTVGITLQVDDLPEGTSQASQARLTVRHGDASPEIRTIPLGEPVELDFPVDHGGDNLFEFEVEPLSGELTDINNRAAVVVNGVRDRLRVLLVSGEPHAGERTWRDTLKSDPSVDLIHFTILRPPEKQDGTPTDELSLIVFPIRELFEVKLNDFDLIIFDRYKRRGVLPSIYYHNIADYVRNGGALLEASGPSFASNTSVYRTALGDVLPGEPTGNVIEDHFVPSLTEDGNRHPVTAGLDEAYRNGTNGAVEWGRWMRQIPVTQNGGNALMSGFGDDPLLILERVEEGRVAQFTSDHMWLWARGYEGGGPQAELMRRVAHWLMREPELEEEDLRADVDGNRIRLERRSLTPEERTVSITTPQGETDEVTLGLDEDGRAIAEIDVRDSGVYRFDDGEKSTFAVVGRLNPPEFTDVLTSAAPLSPAAEATGGSIEWVAEDGTPAIRRVPANRATSGSGWIGLVQNGAYEVTGVREAPLLPGLVILLGGLGILLMAWRREGR